MEASGDNASASLVDGTFALEFDDETLRGNDKNRLNSPSIFVLKSLGRHIR